MDPSRNPLFEIIYFSGDQSQKGREILTKDFFILSDQSVDAVHIPLFSGTQFVLSCL